MRCTVAGAGLLLFMGLLHISIAQDGRDASAAVNSSAWVQLAGDLRTEIDALEALIALQQKRLANLRRLLQYERSYNAGRLPVSAASDRSSDFENSCLGETCVAPATIPSSEPEQPPLGWLQAPQLMTFNGQQNDTTGYQRLLRLPAPVLPSKRTPLSQPADAHKLLKVADSGIIILADQPVADVRELLQRHGGGSSTVVAADACSDPAASRTSRAGNSGSHTSSSSEQEASPASILIALATNSSRLLVVRIDRARGGGHGTAALVCAADVPGRLAFVGGHATAAAAAGTRSPSALRCLLNPGTRKHPQPVPGLLLGTTDGLLLSYSAVDCSLLRLVFPPVAPAQQQQSQQEQTPAAQQWSAGPVTAIAVSESRVAFAVGSHVHFFSPQRSELSRTVCRLEGMGAAAPPPPPHHYGQHSGQQHAAGGDAGGAGGAAVVSDLAPDPSTSSWIWVGLADGGFLLVSAGLGVGPGGGSCVLRHTFSHLKAPPASTLQTPHRVIAGSDSACNIDAHAVSVAVHPGFVVAANSRGLLALNSTALAADRPASAATLLHAAWPTTASLGEEGAAPCPAASEHAAAPLRCAAQVLLHLLPTTPLVSPQPPMAGQKRAATPLPTVALTVFRGELGASETYALLPPLRGTAVNPFGAGADSSGDDSYGSGGGGGLGWLRFLLVGGALVGVFAWRRWGLQPGKRRRGQRRGELPTDILDDEEREAERRTDDEEGTDEQDEEEGGFLNIGPSGRSMSQTLLRGMAGIASLGGKALAGRGPLGGLLHMLGVELHAQRRGRQRDDAALRRGLGLGPIDAPDGDEGAAGASGRETWARQSPFSDAPLPSAAQAGLRNRRQGPLAQLPGSPTMSFGGGALPPHLQRMLTQRLAAENAAAGNGGGARRGGGTGRSGGRSARGAGDDEEDDEGDDDDPLGGFSREQFDTMDAAFERLAARARRKRDRSLRDAAAAGGGGSRGRGAGAGARSMMPPSPSVSDGSSGSSKDGDGGAGGHRGRGSSRGSGGGTPSELAAAEEAMLESQMAREGGSSGAGGSYAPMPLTSQHPHFTSPTSQRSQQRSGPSQWASLASSLASAPLPFGSGASADGEEGDDATLAAAMANSVFQQHTGGAGFSDEDSSAAQRQRRIASALTARPDSPSAYLRQGYLPPDADGEVPEPGRTHAGTTGMRRRTAPRSASSAAAALAHRMAERADAGVLDPDAIADGGGGGEYTSDDDA